MQFDQVVGDFITACSFENVRMIMVGGGAVNFHGYQRHSADVDFWIQTDEVNLKQLKKSLHKLNYDFEDFPAPVRQREQNISIKISPVLEIELITQFDPGIEFEEAWQNAKIAHLILDKKVEYRVLNYETLIESKIRSGRPKDLLDIQELKRIRGEDQ